MVTFELPGFATTAGGTKVDSLAALRAASETAYFRDKDSLWVKLVVDQAVAAGPVVERVGALRAQANIDVRR